MDEVGEKMMKTRGAGGKAAKEGGAAKVKEGKQAMRVTSPNGIQRKSPSPAKK